MIVKTETKHKLLAQQTTIIFRNGGNVKDMVYKVLYICHFMEMKMTATNNISRFLYLRSHNAFIFTLN